MRDRGAIYLMPIWVEFVDYKMFDFYFKNFPFRWECHEVTFGTSLTYCLFADMLLISLPVMFKVTGLAYIECHAVRNHSVVLIHRLLDVKLF